MIAKNVDRREFKYMGPPPSEWFWKPHRIPRELENLAKGLNYGFGYLSSWGIIWAMPNGRDRLEYLRRFRKC